LKTSRKGWIGMKYLARLLGSVLIMIVALVLFTGVEVRAASGMNVFRLYNPNTGEHLFTTNNNERSVNEKAGWIYEGIAWVAPTKGVGVYRLYNPNAVGGDHYYTKNTHEVADLLNRGWQMDNAGVPMFYSGGNTKVYIAYNPNAQSGAHHYMTSNYEHQNLLNNGWQFGTVAFDAIGIGKLDEKAAAQALALQQKKNAKLIALTFDDGPKAQTTSQLLDILKREQVQATFFMLGQCIAGNPDIVRRAYAEGHQIGTHTYNHVNLTKVGRQTALNEIQSGELVAQQVVGVPPTAFRAPFGAITNDIAALTPNPVIGWSVDTQDWLTRNADTTYQRVMSESFDGAIVLMHDIHPSTIQAADRIIPALKAQGYRLVTVQELLELRGKTGQKIVSVARR